MIIPQNRQRHTSPIGFQNWRLSRETVTGYQLAAVTTIRTSDTVCQYGYCTVGTMHSAAACRAELTRRDTGVRHGHETV
jgi:hypothetical protein